MKAKVAYFIPSLIANVDWLESLLRILEVSGSSLNSKTRHYWDPSWFISFHPLRYCEL